MKSPRGFTWILGVLLVTAGAFGAQTAAAPADTAKGAATAPVLDVTQADENNTTVQQRDPDVVEDDSDPGELRNWLSDRMAGRLSESSIQLSEGEYEQADRLIGDEYNELLSKYVDVAGETGAADTDAGQALNETVTQQRSYTELVTEYREVYQEYQAAVDAGNESRARELARRLRDLASQIEGIEVDLQASYESLSETTGADMEDASASVNETTETISGEVEAVVADEFTNTSISATATPGSFSTPLQITGRLTAPDGDLPASPVTVRVADKHFQVDLNASGAFTLAYQPVTMASGSQQLPVEFFPSNESVFLGSQTSTVTTVEPITPSVSIDSAPTAVAYGERVPVRGRVVADGVGVPDTPVVVRVGDVGVASTRTNATGGFAVSPTLPPGVTVNASTVSVIAGENGTAIAEETEQREVTVRETATTISVDAAHSAKSVTLTGRLRAEQDRPVGGQPVAVSVNGVAVETVQTNASGHYETQVPASALANDTVSVSVTFDGTGLNLASASATTTVNRSAGGLPGFVADQRAPPWWLLLLFVVSLAGSGYAIRRYLRMDRSGETGDADEHDHQSDPGGGPAADETPRVIQDRLSTAQARLADGDAGAAVRLLYPAVRSALGDQESGAQTNWEFYRSVVDDVDNETARTLRTVTEAYEQVVYAGSAPSTAEVRSLVAEVRDVVEDGDRVAYPSGP